MHPSDGALENLKTRIFIFLEVEQCNFSPTTPNQEDSE